MRAVGFAAAGVYQWYGRPARARSRPRWPCHNAFPRSILFPQSRLPDTGLIEQPFQGIGGKDRSVLRSLG